LVAVNGILCDSRIAHVYQLIEELMLDGVHPQTAAFTANNQSNHTDRSSILTPNSEHEEKTVTSRQVRTMPGQSEVGPDGRKRDSFELSQEAEEIRQLQARDREVRAHEAAHAAAGGAYAGAPTYSFERGSDGQTYAVGGEVSIDVSPVPGDPQATLQKAQQVRAAALAPAEPSSQDMRVAQRAQSMASKAQQEISREMSEELKAVSGMTAAINTDDNQEQEPVNKIDAPKNNNRTGIDNIPIGIARLSVHS
jgi:hypothetical protein